MREGSREVDRWSQQCAFHREVQANLPKRLIRVEKANLSQGGLRGEDLNL